MALTHVEASNLANKTRKYIYTSDAEYPFSTVTITIANYHFDNPIIQCKVNNYRYRVVYIPCIILGSETRVI